MDPQQLLPGYRKIARASVDIGAPLDEVWRHLTEVGRYPEWGTFVVAVDAPQGVGVGAHFRLRVRLGYGARWVAPQRCVTFEPPSGGAASWIYRYDGLSTRLGLLRTRRWHGLEALGDERTRYRTIETMAGPLSRLVLIGAVERGLERQAVELRRRSER